MAFFIRLTDNLEKRDPIQWGITHESVALTEYCKEGDVSVLPTGNLILRNYRFCVSLNQGECFLQISFIYSTVSNFTSKNVQSILFYWMFRYPPSTCKQSLKGDIIFKMSVCVSVVMILFGHIFWGDCNGWISTLIIQSYLLTCICTMFFKELLTFRYIIHV